MRSRLINTIFETGSVESITSRSFIIENYFDIKILKIEKSGVVPSHEVVILPRVSFIILFENHIFRFRFIAL